MKRAGLGLVLLVFALLTGTGAAAQKVANPSFTPSSGLYSSTQQVSISCATDGATIRYTTNGTDPTQSSTLYTDPVTVSETTTLKARAFKEDYVSSDVVTGLYIIERGDETTLYLREKWILSEEMGSPVPWLTNYVYPQDGSRSFQWEGRLTGDISGTYSWNIDVVESDAAGAIRIDLIMNQDGATTTVASFQANVPALSQGTYFPISVNLSGIDLQTQDGDLFALKITQISGSERIGIGLDGVYEWCDSHVNVFYNGPIPCFLVSPQEGDLNSEFFFDASCSSDNSYPSSDLEVRWDWEGDGTYDTSFSTEKTAVHQYSSSGVKRVKLQVRNPDGLVRTKTGRITIDMVILSSFDAPGPAPAGLTWDGSHLWFSDAHDDLIYKLTPSGEIVTSFASPCGDPLDLAWDGQYLWVIDAQGTDGTGNIIYKVDVSGNTITSFSVPRDISTGLTWDGHFLWGTDGTNGRIAKIDPSNGDVVVSFSSPGSDPRGLAWDGEHLWVADFINQEIYKIDVNGNLLSTYPAPGTGPMGLAWDGANLWCVDIDSYKIYQLTDKIPTAITCLVSDSDITLGEKVTISGQISPAPGEAGIGISIELTPPEGDTIYRATLANINGEFEYSILCNDITKSGTWSIRTSWAGRGPYVKAESESVSLQVAPATVRITVNSTSLAIKSGETVDISGKLTPQPDCGRDLSGIPLEVRLTAPGGTTIVEPVVTSDPYGHFVLQDYAGMSELGIWDIEVSFAGNSGYSGSSSASVSVQVAETAGYAILVQGKISSDEGLLSHKKTANYVYGQMKARGLLDEDIRYFTYDTSFPGYDAVPTRAGIQEAITQWAVAKMNDKPANLYIVMVDHGFDDVFYIDPETIGAADLASWLNSLQGNLDSEAVKQEIIVILGFCRAGSLINDLSGSKRVIIASADASESSYKGPLDADNIREGEYFVSEFFKSVAFGRSVKACFETATALTEQFTATGTGLVNAPFYDDSRQHPLLDDNGDGVGSNDLSDPSGDGALCDSLFIGVSALTGNDPGDVAILQVAYSVFLGEGENSADLWAKVDNKARLDTLWIEVKAPAYSPVDPGGSGQAEMVLPKSAWENYNSVLDRYEWPSHTGFNDSGIYQVFYFAKDQNTGHVSPLIETKVYKAKAGNNPPGLFALGSPADGGEVLTTVVLDWEDALDPDGDPLTYTVLLSKGDPAFSEPIRIEGMIYSTCLVGPSQGIEDLSEYYWQVQAIDRYGAVTETGVRRFHTNNTNPVVGWISGHVYNVTTKQSISSAVVSVGGLSFPSGLGGYYLGQVPPGTYGIRANAGGYTELSYAGVVIGDGALVSKDFALEPESTPGDVDGDGILDLEDAVTALKIMSGTGPSDGVNLGADVNGDGRIGMEEILYIMQAVGGLR